MGCMFGTSKQTTQPTQALENFPYVFFKLVALASSLLALALATFQDSLPNLGNQV